MKVTILISLALFSFALSAGAQDTADCVLKDCTPFISLVQNCGVDISTTNSDTVVSDRQNTCICGSSNAPTLISTCITCLKLSNPLDSRYDSYAELCPGSSASSGSRSRGVFGGAPYIVGGLMVGMGVFGVAA